MNLVNIKLHGHLGAKIGENWDLAVKSVGEAVHAINCLTGKLYKYLAEKDKEGANYRVLINGRDFKYSEKPSIDNLESIKTSELAMRSSLLKTIDIVPIIEGSEDVVAIVLGVILIVVGIILLPAGIGAALIIGGIGLIAAGIINLLSSPPQFEDFRGGGKQSYLFNGPINVTNEGGPVPVGYGRLIVGSQVTYAAYEVTRLDASAEPLTI